MNLKKERWRYELMMEKLQEIQTEFEERPNTSSWKVADTQF